MVNRYAIIEGATVLNVAVAEADFAAEQGWIEAPAQVGPGWSYENGEFTPPPSGPDLAPVPQSITFAQLLIGLVSEQWISEFEGEQWLQGVLPPQVTSLIETLPLAEQFPAKARAARPSVVLRNDPLVVSMGAAQNKTAEEIDDFFRTYAQV